MSMFEAGNNWKARSVLIQSVGSLRKICLRSSYYAHTNRFCVVQENIKPEVLKVLTELARSVH